MINWTKIGDLNLSNEGIPIDVLNLKDQIGDGIVEPLGTTYKFAN